MNKTRLRTWSFWRNGVLEALGALFLLHSRTAAWGALVLGVVMVGAASTHVATGLGSPWHATRNLMLLSLIAWGRWTQAVRPRPTA